MVGKMNKFVKLASLLLTTSIAAGVIPSCGPNSNNQAIKPLFLYVGYRYNSTSVKYATYTDEDLKILNEIGVSEVCINFGNAAASYIPDGETEPKPIVTEDDIKNITLEMIGSTSGGILNTVISDYLEKIKGLDEKLLIEDFADFAIEFAERLVAVNPEIEIWYTFPDIFIASLAELYIEPFLHYYDRLKAGTDPDIWRNNIKGMYWAREDVPVNMYDNLNTENTEDFDNATVKAMKACADAAHKDGKLTFWCPYFRNNNDVARPIGYVANQTDIFDYVIIQPGYVFDESLKGNIDIIKESTIKNAVLDDDGVPYGGDKKSDTVIGPEIEMQAENFNGANGKAAEDRYQAYVDNYKDMLGKYPLAFYCGSRPSQMDDKVIEFLKEFLKDSK